MLERSSAQERLQHLARMDDNIPSFEEVHAEALKATRYLSSSTPSNEPSALEQEDFREVIHI